MAVIAQSMQLYIPSVPGMCQHAMAHQVMTPLVA